MPANEHVLERDEHGVTVMELAGHVRRGDDDDEWFFIGVNCGREIALRFPPIVQTLFGFAWVVGFWHFVRHFRNLIPSPSPTRRGEPEKIDKKSRIENEKQNPFHLKGERDSRYHLV